MQARSRTTFGTGSSARPTRRSRRQREPRTCTTHLALPDEYETVIGERGSLLSGGERQRISVARAFLKDSPIAILDEPTSSVDSQTEAVILAALERLMAGRTTFTIAHRLSTIRRADVILVLNEGRLVQQGTHEELVSEGGLYRTLHDLQFGMAEVDVSADGRGGRGSRPERNSFVRRPPCCRLYSLLKEGSTDDLRALIDACPSVTVSVRGRSSRDPRRTARRLRRSSPCPRGPYGSHDPHRVRRALPVAGSRHLHAIHQEIAGRAVAVRSTWISSSASRGLSSPGSRREPADMLLDRLPSPSFRVSRTGGALPIGEQPRGEADASCRARHAPLGHVARRPDARAGRPPPRWRRRPLRGGGGQRGRYWSTSASTA